MPKGKSGIKREVRKQISKESQIFDWPGLGKMSSEALKAVLEAPVGTKIQARTIGFGSYNVSDYEITLRGMSKKMLSTIHNPGSSYHKPLVLSKANIKRKLSGSQLTLEYPRA